MGRELRWHLARAGREKLKGLGKTRAPSADRGNPGPLKSQLSGRDSICAKTFKTSCAPAIWSARSPESGLVKWLVSNRIQAQMVELEAGDEATSTNQSVEFIYRRG